MGLGEDIGNEPKVHSNIPARTGSTSEGGNAGIALKLDLDLVISGEVNRLIVQTRGRSGALHIGISVVAGKIDMLAVQTSSKTIVSDLDALLRILHVGLRIINAIVNRKGERGHLVGGLGRARTTGNGVSSRSSAEAGGSTLAGRRNRSRGGRHVGGRVELFIVRLDQRLRVALTVKDDVISSARNCIKRWSLT